jgi:hypothetical protein
MNGIEGVDADTLHQWLANEIMYLSRIADDNAVGWSHIDQLAAQYETLTGKKWGE